MSTGQLRFCIAQKRREQLAGSRVANALLMFVERLGAQPRTPVVHISGAAERAGQDILAVPHRDRTDTGRRAARYSCGIA